MTTARPLATIDQEYPLAPRTIANKRRLSELQVRSRIIPRADREAICEAMAWPADRVADDLPEDAYYLELARLLFPAAPVDDHADDVDQEVVARAAGFFRRASLGASG